MWRPLAWGRATFTRGGAEATSTLLGWLQELPEGPVLEIGPGLGLSTLRLLERGRAVEAIEPNAELARLYRQRTGVQARPLRAEELGLMHEGRYAAVLAESVLYGTDLPLVLRAIAGALQPGGGLLFSEAVWCEGTSAAEAGRLNTESDRRFGIPMASAEPWGWGDWRRMIGEAGLELVREERLGEGSPGGPTREGGWAGAVRDPAAALGMARLRWRQRGFERGEARVESWIGMARRRSRPE